MTRPVPLRPALLPGLRRLWRDRHTLQLGTDPVRSTVLEFTDPAAARLLDLLDGARTERMVLAEAVRRGISEPAARLVLTVLGDAGLVVGAHTLLPSALPEPARRRLAAEAAAIALRGTHKAATPARILAHRAATRVVLTGRGVLATPVALALAQSGIGHVAAALEGSITPCDALAGGLLPTDIGRHRASAVADAVRRAAPGTRTGPIRPGRADVVIHLGPGVPAILQAAAQARRGVAHLALDLREAVPVVGPLVPPAGTPCLNCLDLHRGDRDPAWPRLAPQLNAAAADAQTEPCSAPTLLAAAGFAAAEVLSYVDGGVPETVGATVEFTAPARPRRRTWPPHPACDCVRGARTRGHSQPHRSQ